MGFKNKAKKWFGGNNDNDNDQAAEAERQRIAAEAAAEAERQRIAAAAEAERQRIAAAERQRIAAAEAERQRIAAAAAEAERQRIAAEAAAEAERRRIAAIESERQRLAAIEAERQRLAAIEAERQRLAAIEAERQRIAAEAAAAEAERQRIAAEAAEAERRRIAEAERQRIAAAEAAERERVRQNDNCTSTTPSWKFANSNGPLYPLNQNSYIINWEKLKIKSNANMSVSFLLKITSSYKIERNIFNVTNSNNTINIQSCSISQNDTYMNIINTTINNLPYSVRANTFGLNNTIFVTITWNNRTIRYYINGTLSETYNVDKFIDADQYAILYIGGKSQNGGVFIKNFSMYDCCLSPASISSIYGNNSSMVCSYNLSSVELDCYKNNYPTDLLTMNPSELQTHWSNIGCKEERNNQCPSQQISSGLYNYKGCYNDTSMRAISEKLSYVSSIDECAVLAENKRKNVFGVQNSGECWVGNNEQEAYQYGVNFNKYSCPEMGGTNTNQVYVRQEIFPPPPPSVPYLTKPNFAYKENFSNMLDGEYENQKTNYSILIIIIILIFMLLIFLPILYK
jgi:chemotaxis protein histidine kinase CheA